MTTSNSKPPDDGLSEMLVAYLDGELSAAECEAIEERIRNDEQARLALQKYDRVWNALDDLPRATVDDGFTRTTIEMAASEAKQELAHQTAMLPVRRRNRWLKLAGLLTAAAVVGFVAVASLLPNPNRVLFANLPVILQLDAYSEVRDVEFLRMLHEESGDWLLDEWGEEIADEADALAELSSANYSQRRSFVVELDEGQRTTLASKSRRYQALPAAMREELVTRHAEIAAAPDAEDLQKTMLAYYSWVSQFPEDEQVSLRYLPPEQRVARVEAMQERLERENEFHLSPANAVALRDAFEKMLIDPEMLDLHRQFVEALPDRRKLSRPDNGEEFRLRKIVEWFSESEPRRAIPMIEMASGFSKDYPQLPRVNEYRDAIEARLLAALDDETAQRLREKDQQARSRHLGMWLAMSKRQRTPDIATLKEYFVSGNISPEVQHQLLSMPDDEMLRALERMYIEEFLGEENVDHDFRRMMRVFVRGRWSDDRDDRREDNRRDDDRHDNRRDKGRRGDDRHDDDHRDDDRHDDRRHDR